MLYKKLNRNLFIVFSIFISLISLKLSSQEQSSSIKLHSKSNATQDDSNTVQTDTIKFEKLFFLDSLKENIMLLKKVDTLVNIILSTNNNDLIEEINKKGNCVKNKYFEFSTDQDIFAKLDSDRDYTMGVGLNWFKINSNDYYLKYLRIPFLMKKRNLILDRYLNLFKSSLDPTPITITSAGIIHSAFTPDSLEKWNVDTTDRPYAAVTLLSSKLFKVKAISCSERFNFSTKIGFESDFGIVGKFPAKLSQFIQAGIHAGMAANKNDTFHKDTRPIPRGWENAIGYPHCLPIFNYSISQSFNFQFKLFKSNHWLLRSFNMNIHNGLKSEIGLLYTNISDIYGFEIGWFNNSALLFGNNFNYDLNSLNKSKSICPKFNKTCIDLSFIFNYTKSFWFYNTTLSGYPINDNSPYTLNDKEVNKFTYFYEYGGKIRIRDLITISYLQAFRSPVTKLFPKRIQEFGRVYLTFNLN